MSKVERCFTIVAAMLCVTCASADEYAGKATGTAAPRYTFSWPLDANAIAPRGGTTKGPPVTLDREPGKEWRELRAAGLSSRERDRRAILAMAGTYRVTFDFLEVVPFSAQEQPTAPYQSWGTEKIYVDGDDGKVISLVHILEMRILQQDGSIGEPMVTKHWRQDWQYQPAHIVEYRGRDRWQRRKLPAAESTRAWLQTVYQVDESPRYASIGRWEHSSSFSHWLSAATWRPLPRREWSVRDDYQVLVGTNRHTVSATGWVQEENNLKTVLTEAGDIDQSRPYVAREYGVARYERIRDAEFASADRYYAQTRQFWDQVRAQWSQIFLKQGEVTLKGPVDQLGLFHPLFAQADAVAERGAAASAQNEVVIRDALKNMGALR